MWCTTTVHFSYYRHRTMHLKSPPDTCSVLLEKKLIACESDTTLKTVKLVWFFSLSSPS